MWHYLNKGISTPIAIGIILILVILVGGFTWWQYSEIRKDEADIPEIDISEKEEIILGTDPFNSTYIIDGNPVTLENGTAEKEILPGSATKIRTSIFGEPVWGDINSDDVDDAVLLLTHDPGGSGTFYYITAAIKTSKGYRGANTILIGDRIAPKDTHVDKDGFIRHNYADRASWEPFSVKPWIGKTKYLRIEEGSLKELPEIALPEETAATLVEKNWGGCIPDMCSELTVNILDGRDGVWFVEAIYEGMRDDSVQAQRKIARVHYVDKAWKLGEIVLTEYRCQPGRGQQEFSSELCI